MPLKSIKFIGGMLDGCSLHGVDTVLRRVTAISAICDETEELDDYEFNGSEFVTTDEDDEDWDDDDENGMEDEDDA